MVFFGKLTFGGLVKFFAMRAVEGLIILLVLFFLPNIPPHCKFQTPYKLSPTLPLEGKLALNEKLDNVKFWHHQNIHGPEAFAAYNGELYTSLQSGEIVKLSGEQHISPIIKFGKACNYFEEAVCGRPLGLAFDKTGTLYAADAYYGIFKVDVKTGEKKQLVSPNVEIDGKKPKLFNSIAIASTGEIYWTDSSTEFDLSDGVFDMLADGSGRLIKYDPKSNRNTVLVDNLHFPNGVQLTQNEDALVFSVTSRSLLYKYHLKGPKAGQYEVLIDGLPGSPDNIQSDGYGGFLVGLIHSHDTLHPNPIQMFGPFPWIRKLISRILGLTELGFKVVDNVYPNDYAKMGVYMVGHFSVPLKMIPLNKRTTILHVSEKGAILNSWHTTSGKMNAISEAFIFNDQLLLGSPFNEYIGRIPLKELGLKPLPIPPKTHATKPPPTVQTTRAPTTTTTPAPKVTTTSAPKVTTTSAPKVTTTSAPKVTTTSTPKVTTTSAPKVTTTSAPITKPTQETTTTPKPTAATNKPVAAQKRDVPKQQEATKPKTVANEPPQAKATAKPAAPTQAPKATTRQSAESQAASQKNEKISTSNNKQ